MTVLLIGSSYFHDALEVLGVNVLRVGIEEDCDVRISAQDPNLARLIARLGFEPEAVILTDNLGRRVPT